MRGLGQMSAMRPEPAQVQMNDGRPGRFVWRGRLYTVLAILQRPGETTSADEHAHDPDAPAANWHCWRVTAAPGRNVPAVGFRLCQDPATDRWLLSRDG
jgi:hypothetical protein